MDRATVFDDRGLEDAEAFLHEYRHLQERMGHVDPRLTRAIGAVGEMRSLTKRGRALAPHAPDN